MLFDREYGVRGPSTVYVVVVGVVVVSVVVVIYLRICLLNRTCI